MKKLLILSLLSVSVASVYGAGLIPYNPNLVAYYPISTTTDTGNFIDDVIDYSGHGAQDGTTGQSGGTILLDPIRGGDVVATVQGHRFTAGIQDINLAEGFTWSLWVKSDSAANADGGADVIIGSRAGIWNKVQANGTARFFDHSYNIDDDTWHHIAYTGRSTGLNTEISEFWIDGVKVSTDSNGSFGNNQIELTALQIGGANSFSEDWTGLIDDIAIFNTVLSDERIQEIAAGASVVIPEPSTALLGALGALVLLHRRR
ncbi:MAG: LamG domain-containing protein [Akkermansiaceae bacterium]